MTAGDVVDRIKKNIGVPWRDTTYRDTYKAGGPETPVTGIATTMFNSFDVLQRAVAAGLNMIVPHETTFWSARTVHHIRRTILGAELNGVRSCA